MRDQDLSTVDIVMLGSFGLWTRGTLQSRALPFARAVSRATGWRIAIVTTPWDDPSQSGVREEIDGIAIYNTEAVHPHKAPTVVWQQVQLVQRLRPRLVHVMKPKAAAGMTVDVLARIGHMPCLIVDHDDWEGDGGWNDRSEYPLPVRRLFAYQERRLIRRADGVTAASTLLESRARQLRHQSTDDSITFLPNGLERAWMTELNRAADTGNQLDTRRLVLYSRFAEFSRAWLEQLLRSVNRMLSAPAELHIVGSGGEAELMTRLEQLQIFRHGYVARTELPALLGASSVAIYPYEDNLINRSKQSVKLLELMASGCAVVASDVGDVRRIGADAVATVVSGDAAAFAGSVVELLEHPSRARDLGRAAIQRAARFEIDRLAGRLIERYQHAGLS